MLWRCEYSGRDTNLRVSSPCRATSINFQAIVFETIRALPRLHIPFSMHQTATRPAPLVFPLSHVHAAFGVQRQKDSGHPTSQRTPVYFEAPIRNGLHTPPDDMGTAYQQPQYNQYGNRSGTSSGQGEVTQGSYGACSGNGVQGRQYSAPHSSVNQLPLPSASTLHHEAHILQPSYRVSNPLQTAINTFARPEEHPRKPSTNGDTITKALQIPAKINSSGGSLGEFAAQVRFFHVLALDIGTDAV